MNRTLSLLVILSVSVVLVNCANQNKKVETPTATTHSLQSVYFDFDLALIRSDMVSAMEGNAAYLKQNSGTSVMIEGNCDNRGTNEYNLALGQRRAQSAKNYLSNIGVDSSRMRTVSYGEEKPVCHENDESCWQRNRRADFRRQ